MISRGTGPIYRLALVGSVGIALLGALVACGSTTTPAPQTTSSPTQTINAGDGLAVDAQPEPTANGGQCSFLDADWVATTNGQRVLATGTDPRFTPPACVFYSYDPQPQLQVWVRQMPTPGEATAVVDHFAPIGSTDPADSPAGWMGGRQGHAQGSLYAVAKGAVAVVVLSNQPQSIKAEEVALETIRRLGL